MGIRIPEPEITLNILNNKIALDRECWGCGIDIHADGNGECEICSGIGRVPTEAGEAIISLMQRYKNTLGVL